MRLNIFVFLLLAISCSKDDPAAGKFSISGKITEREQAVAGVPIALNNHVHITTDADGNYHIENLSPGTYVIKPDEAGKLFLPAEQSITVTNNNVLSADFVRAATDQVVHRERIWTLFRPTVYSIKQNTAETLQLDLLQNALWYQNSQGGLVYVELTGDFTVTARANAVRKTDNSQPVSCNVCLGGLMVRNSNTSSGENYVHLVTGNTPNGLGVEYKSTTNGVSVYNTIVDGSTLHDLRIQRSGSTFTLFQKLPAQSTWSTVTTYTRSDLPASVMVGVNIYTAAGGAVADLSLIIQDLAIN